MGLDEPTLDDRPFEDLIEDARRRIPAVAEQWTDHNATDPGITILEALAWVAETDVYRLDRVTERHVRKYLQLLGVHPRPPQPATVDLAVRPERDEAGTTLEAGERLSAERGDGTVAAFETTEELVLTDVDVAAVVSRHAAGRSDNTDRNESDGLHFLAFGEDANRNSAMYLGFEDDPYETAGRLDLWIDFHEANLPEPATHGPDPARYEPPPVRSESDGEDEDHDDGGGGEDDTDGEGGADDADSGGDADPFAGLEPDEPVTFEPSAEVTWQYCRDVDNWLDGDSWQAFDADEVDDETNELYRGGSVRLDEPEDWAETDEMRILGVERPMYWVRCVVTEPGHEVVPQLDAVRTNVVEARHGGRRTDGERLRRPDGRTETTADPDQEFVFERSPVRDVTLRVGGDEWVEVSDFAASGPDDRHYVVERSRGLLRFGDGINGSVPAPDQAVVAETYGFGGGRDGNVTASADWQFVDDRQVASTRALGPATGGEDAESIDDALARLRRDLDRPYRAVTSDDVSYVAEHTPGLRFGRTAVHVEDGVASGGSSGSGVAGGGSGASGLSGGGSSDGSSDSGDSTGESGDCAAHGTIHVTVVPAAGETTARPQPSDGFLEAVREHLCRHRLLTDAVAVERPEYVGIAVETEIEIVSGHDQSRRVEAVRDALDEFLDPLHGFDGEGWPFGRSVYRSELYEVIGDVSGVDCVEDVTVTGRGEFSVVEGAIDVPERALVYPLEHTVVVRSDDGSCRRWER